MSHVYLVLTFYAYEGYALDGAYATQAEAAARRDEIRARDYRSSSESTDIYRVPIPWSGDDLETLAE
jgi:hypothetical protein